MKTRKLTLTAILIAINVVLSSIVVIPLGPIKAAPIQHLINVICGICGALVWSGTSVYFFAVKNGVWYR